MGKIIAPSIAWIFKKLLIEIMGTMKGTLLVGEKILRQLGVHGVYVVDSTTITLPDWAALHFPGTGSDAAVKWHTVLNVFSGCFQWNWITEGTKNDRKCFPEIKDLAGKLIIFDLGYFDFTLMQHIDIAGGFYLCRLKSNTVVMIREVVQGLGKSAIGKSLMMHPKKRRGNLIEVFCDYERIGLRLRVIGFWNPILCQYHWYATNLEVAAIVIYPLYRLRWQIELMFKGCKQSLNLDGIASGNKNIIESLLLASLVAQFTSQTILRSSMTQLEHDKKFAVSYQRISKVFCIIAKDFIPFLLSSVEDGLERLMRKIDLFFYELFDPNYRRRRSTIKIIQDTLNA